MVFKCKICGGQVQVDRAAGLCICEYCGTKQTIPQFSDDSSKRLFDSGNNYLQHSEYDKAENVFNQLLSLNPQDAEVYWSITMCKYGVTFVCDPRTGKYIPTCNRTHYESILKDRNYLNALRYSSGEKNAFYQESAKTIDEIQKGIISISRKEKPFDIFISYKETDVNGNRTKDSVVAQELYEKLVSEGYKVFFSRITLEDKIGSEYEPYIYAALSSSKVMLTVCSSKDNIEAPWVKNEWNRFLTLRQADSSKILIPLFFEMPKEDLPDEFSIFPAQDIGKEDYEQELIRGIKKLIPLPIMLKEKRKRIRKRLGIASIIIAIIVVVAVVISLPYINENIALQHEYDAAMELYESGKYSEAISAFEKISDFRDSKEMIQKSKDGINTIKYNEALQLYYDGNYPEAAWAFRDLDKFSDSEKKKEEAELAWRNLLSTVATRNRLGSMSQGSYYISANGSVETFDFDSGNSNKNIEINEHGKIVSIADNYELYALHEDGYVTNSKKNNKIDSDWENIIQISPVFNATNIALTTSGEVVYGNIQNEYNKDQTDSWLEDVKNWHDIVSLDFDLERAGYGALTGAAILGIKSDGTVSSVFYKDEPEATAFVNSLSNIKKISVNANTYNGNISIAAIDKSGVVYTFEDGESNQYKDLKTADVEANDYYDNDNISNAFYTIDSRRSLAILNSENSIVEDVVYINKDFLVTLSGNIYHTYNVKDKSPQTTVAKTRVQDVWLERE